VIGGLSETTIGDSSTSSSLTTRPSSGCTE
jgi:hypothetical protein